MDFVIDKSEEAKKIAGILKYKLGKDALNILLKDCEFFVCGGALLSLITQQPINDFDIFFPDSINYGRAKKQYDNWDMTNPHIETIDGFSTPNSINIRLGARKRIQLVHKVYFPTIEETLSIFDFRAVMLGVTNQNLEKEDGIYRERNSLYDIAKKLLVVMPNHRHPFNVMIRIAKYMKRGWTIHGRSFIHLILQQIQRGKEIETVEDVKQEIIGIDTFLTQEFFKEFNDIPGNKKLDKEDLDKLAKKLHQFFDGCETDEILP